MPIEIRTGQIAVKDEQGNYHYINSVTGQTVETGIVQIQNAAEDAAENMSSNLTTAITNKLNSISNLENSYTNSLTDINEMIDILNAIQLNFLPMYDQHSQYQYGDYVLYNNNDVLTCYMCINNQGAGNEAFNPNDWEEKQIRDNISATLTATEQLNDESSTALQELGSLKSDLLNALAENTTMKTDINALITALQNLKYDLDHAPDALENDLGGFKQQLTNYLTTVESRVSDINTFAADEIDRIRTLINGDANANPRVIGISEQITAVQGQMSTLNSSLESAENQLSSISEGIESTVQTLIPTIKESAKLGTYNILPATNAPYDQLMAMLRDWWSNGSSLEMYSDTHTGLFGPASGKTRDSIDCADLVCAILLGIKYANSTYTRNISNNKIQPLITEHWLDTNSTNEDKASQGGLTTPELAQWFSDKNRLFKLPGSSEQNWRKYKVVTDLLQFGDIIFYSNSTAQNTYNISNECGIVLNTSTEYGYSQSWYNALSQEDAAEAKLENYYVTILKITSSSENILSSGKLRIIQESLCDNLKRGVWKVFARPNYKNSDANSLFTIMYNKMICNCNFLIGTQFSADQYGQNFGPDSFYIQGSSILRSIVSSVDTHFFPINLTEQQIQIKTSSSTLNSISTYFYDQNYTPLGVIISTSITINSPYIVSLTGHSDYVQNARFVRFKIPTVNFTIFPEIEISFIPAAA